MPQHCRIHHLFSRNDFPIKLIEKDHGRKCPSKGWNVFTIPPHPQIFFEDWIFSFFFDHFSLFMTQFLNLNLTKTILLHLTTPLHIYIVYYEKNLVFRYWFYVVNVYFTLCFKFNRQEMVRFYDLN